MWRGEVGKRTGRIRGSRGNCDRAEKKNNELIKERDYKRKLIKQLPELFRVYSAETRFVSRICKSKHPNKREGPKI